MADGAEGRPGRAGAEGQPGRAGIDGADGRRGSVGDRGERGEPGSSGSDGAVGADGIQGVPGPPGASHRYRPTIRDLVLVLVCVLVLVVLSSGQSTLDKVQQGRQFAVGAICAVQSAITQAGVDSISRSALKDSPFTRKLEKLGYPSLRTRQAQAAASGQAYRLAISHAIDTVVGTNGDGLVLPNGQLDCKRFKQLSVVQPVGK